VCTKTKLVEDGVGADESSYLAHLAKSLATYSQHVTVNTTGVTQLSGGNVEALVRGVRALASARTQFTRTPCSYDEVRVSFAVFSRPY